MSLIRKQKHIKFDRHLGGGVCRMFRLILHTTCPWNLQLPKEIIMVLPLCCGPTWLGTVPKEGQGGAAARLWGRRSADGRNTEARRGGGVRAV